MEILAPISVAILVLVLVLVLVVPTIAAFRGCKTPLLSVFVAAIYAVASGILISRYTLSMRRASETETVFRDYYVVQDFYGYMNVAIFFTFVAILLFIQERLGSTIGAWLSLGLFWLINLGTITNIMSVKVLFSLSVPKRFMDYQGAIHILNLISNWATWATNVSILALVLLTVFTAIFGRKHRSAPNQ